MNTGMDDQFARCKVAEEEGWGLVHPSSTSISSSIEKLLMHTFSSSVEERKNGNDELAEILFSS